MTIFFNSSLSLGKYIELLWPVIQLINLVSTVDIRMKFVHSPFMLKFLVCIHVLHFVHLYLQYGDIGLRFQQSTPQLLVLLGRHIRDDGEYTLCTGLGHNNLTNLTLSQHTCVNSPIWSCNLSTDSLEMWSSYSSWH